MNTISTIKLMGLTLQHNTKKWVHDHGAYIYYIFSTSLIVGKFCQFLVTCSVGMNFSSTEAETGPEIQGSK